MRIALFAVFVSDFDFESSLEEADHGAAAIAAKSPLGMRHGIEHEHSATLHQTATHAVLPGIKTSIFTKIESSYMKEWGQAG